jgi:hypothetical protein
LIHSRDSWFSCNSISFVARRRRKKCYILTLEHRVLLMFFSSYDDSQEVKEQEDMKDKGPQRQSRKVMFCFCFSEETEMKSQWVRKTKVWFPDDDGRSTWNHRHSVHSGLSCQGTDASEREDLFKIVSLKGHWLFTLKSSPFQYKSNCKLQWEAFIFQLSPWRQLQI